MYILFKKNAFYHTLKNTKKKSINGYHNKFVIIH